MDMPKVGDTATICIGDPCCPDPEKPPCAYCIHVSITASWPEIDELIAEKKRRLTA